MPYLVQGGLRFDYSTSKAKAAILFSVDLPQKSR